MFALAVLEHVSQDLRYGVRALRKAPAFTAAATVVLGLGIGVNAAIFSLVHAVLLKSLPVREPGELVLFGTGATSGVVSGQTGVYSVFSYPLYEAFRDHNSFFSGLCAFQSQDSRLSVQDARGGAPLAAPGKLVSGNYFAVLGAGAAAGRTLTRADDTPGAPAVAVVSYRYWTSHYGQSRSALGDSIQINRVPFTIVGVAASGFFGDTLKVDPPDFWLPLETEREIDRGREIIDNPDNHWLYLIGRMKADVNVRQAQAGLSLELRQWLTARAGSQPREKIREDISNSRIELTPGGSGITHLRRQYSESLRILMWSAGFVLLVAAGNIAGLFVAYGSSRSLETSVRLALGATRNRLLTQVLIQSVLLAISGGVAGIVLASLTVRFLLLIFFPESRYVPIDAIPGAAVLLYTAAISVVTGVVFGIVPAVRSSRGDLEFVMRAAGGGGKGVVAGGRRFSMGGALAMVQIAVSLPLVVSGGLLARSLGQLEHQRFGFNPERVLMISVDPQLAGYRYDELSGLYQRLRERLKRVRGVRAASLSLYSPFSSQWSSRVSIQGYVSAPNENVYAWWNRVGPDYFETLGTKLLLGRGIGEEDTPGARMVAVVSESFARAYFRNQNPIGKRFGMGDGEGSGKIEIVGVAEDAKYSNPRADAPRMFYIPLLQNSKTRNAVLASALVRSGYIHDIEIRTEGKAALIVSEARRAIAEVDRNLAVLKVTTLKEHVRGSLRQESMIAELTGAFSILAVLLACVGLYGLVTFTVERRTGEIGIRIALGAQTGRVLWTVLRDVVLLMVGGVTVGLIFAFGCTRLIAAKLYGVTALDPPTVIPATLLLVMVGLLAGYLPARRASRVDPMAALRYE